MLNQLEREIAQEANMAENVVAAMQPELRERYLQLKDQNMQYQVKRADKWCGIVTL